MLSGIGRGGVGMMGGGMMGGMMGAGMMAGMGGMMPGMMGGMLNPAAMQQQQAMMQAQVRKGTTLGGRTLVPTDADASDAASNGCAAAAAQGGAAGGQCSPAQGARWMRGEVYLTARRPSKRLRHGSRRRRQCSKRPWRGLVAMGLG